jgi:cell wall-associated NlpC family hydrolase
MKQRFYPLLIGLFLYSFLSAAQDTTQHIVAERQDSILKQDTAELYWQRVTSILQYAEKYKGVRYRRAGKNPKRGFDCSGFVSYLFRKYGVVLPPSSATMAAKLPHQVPLDSVQKGDLLFFKGRNRRNKRIGHVALVHSVSEKGIFMIHATHRKGIVIDNLHKTPYYRVRYVTAKRPEINGT